MYIYIYIYIYIIYIYILNIYIYIYIYILYIYIYIYIYIRERARVYRQPEYQKLKVEEHLRTCGKGIFKIFPYFRCEALKLTYVGVTKEIS